MSQFDGFFCDHIHDISGETHLRLRDYITACGGLIWEVFSLHYFISDQLVRSTLSYLLPAVYTVPPQDWRAARGHPHSCQRVAVHLVLLYDALSLFMLCDTKGRHCYVKKINKKTGNGRRAAVVTTIQGA